MQVMMAVSPSWTVWFCPVYGSMWGVLLCLSCWVTGTWNCLFLKNVFSRMCFPSSWCLSIQFHLIFFDFWLVSIQCSSDIKSKRWKQKFNYFCAWMWGSFKLEWEFYLLWLTMRNDRGLKPIEHNRNGSVEYPQKIFYICWWINCSFFFFSKLCFLNFQFLAN